MELHLIDQIYIHCDPTKSFLMCVVVPVKSLLLDWAAKEQHQLSPLSFEELCAHPLAQQHAQQELARFGHQNSLQAYEIPVVVLLEPQCFTAENQGLTISLKISRPHLFKKYAAPLEALALAMASSADTHAACHSAGDLTQKLTELIASAASDDSTKNIAGSVLDRLGNDSLSAMRFINLVR